MKQKYKILIPNATTPRNVGDLAILTGLLNLIKKEKPNSDITIHSSEPKFHNKMGNIIKPNLYWSTVFETPNTLIRIYKLLHLILLYLSYKYNLKGTWCNCELGALLKDYQDANLIIFVGGGYFRSKPGLTQSLNLIMVASSFKFSTLFKAPKIVAPMSFGPFAYSWQEKYIADILKKINIVEVREDISFLKLKKYLPNLIRGYDQGLLIPKNLKSKRKHKIPVVGFTIRKWLDPAQQTKLEDSFYQTLKNFSILHKAFIQPIAQVDAPEFGETDASIAENISIKLKLENLKVLPLKRIKGVQNAIDTYSKLDLLLGMRLHSNIIAATQEIPFVAVSYEYKTEGVSHDLGLKNYLIDCHLVDQKKLLALLNKAYSNREWLRKTLRNSIRKIKKAESNRWHLNLGQI